MTLSISVSRTWLIQPRHQTRAFYILQGTYEIALTCDGVAMGTTVGFSKHVFNTDRHPVTTADTRANMRLIHI